MKTLFGNGGLKKTISGLLRLVCEAHEETPSGVPYRTLLRWRLLLRSQQYMILHFGSLSRGIRRGAFRRHCLCQFRALSVFPT